MIISNNKFGIESRAFKGVGFSFICLALTLLFLFFIPSLCKHKVEFETIHSHPTQFL